MTYITISKVMMNPWHINLIV